jgi:hypothetical protein
MKELFGAPVDVVPTVKTAAEYEFEVTQVLQSCGSMPLEPALVGQLVDKLRKRDHHIAQLQQRNEEIERVAVAVSSTSTDYKNVVKEVCRAWHGGLNLDALPHEAFDTMKRLGERALVEEYAGELKGEGERPDTVLQGVDDGTTSSGFGATRAKISLAAAQETLRQGLKYKGCDIKLERPGLACITVRMEATPGQALDCPAMKRALERHMGAGDRIKVVADVHTVVPFSE